MGLPKQRPSEAQRPRAPLQMVSGNAEPRRRRSRLDPWLTLSGWLWTGYAIGLAALVIWLLQ